MLETGSAPTSKHWLSSTFKYYGPADDKVTGDALFLSIQETCHPEKRRESVRGRIVVSANRGGNGYQECLLDDVYSELNAAGAAAYINTVTWFPGFNAYRHGTWDTCQFCEAGLTLASVYDPGGELFALRRSDSPVFLAVQPPHDASFREIFDSPTWVFFFRVLLPLFAFSTAGVATFELHRGLRSQAPHHPARYAFLVTYLFFLLLLF